MQVALVLHVIDSVWKGSATLATPNGDAFSEESWKKDIQAREYDVIESEGIACKQSITRTDFKPLPAQVHYIFAIPLCHPQSIRGMPRDDAQVSLYRACNCLFGCYFFPAMGL